MKLTTIILLSACLHVSANGISQTVTLSMKDAPIEKVFKAIKQQTHYVFFSNYELLQKARKVTIDVKNMPLRDVLELCFKDQPFSYVIAGNVITIIPKKNEPKIPNLYLSADDDNIDVKGRVVNEKGEPVAGVSVTIKGTSISTITNESGEFSISNVDQNAVLMFTHVSMEAFEIKVGKKTELTVSLRPKIRELSDVTVQVSTGYQQLPKERATGSFVQISKEQLDQRVAPTILEKLEGITNGLVFNKDPQSGSNKIRIRGESTIFGYSNPLVVVDNFPYKFENINEINPNDVESITILKDAAAASIWGVQAGNGVIIITTKRGKLNQPLRVDLNINATISKKANLSYLPLMSSSDYIDLETYLFSRGRFTADLNDPSFEAVSPVVEILNWRKLGQISATDSANLIDGLRSIDWRDDFLKHIYRNAVNQQYQVSLSGGSNKSSYYFSAGYDKSLPDLIGNESNRITLNNLTTYRPLANLELQVGITYTEGKSTNNSLGSGVPNFYPYMQLVDENGNQLPIPQRRAVFEDTIINRGFVNWKYYPLQERTYRDNISKSHTTRVLASLKYALLKGLNLEASYQYYRAIGKNRNLSRKDSYSIRNSMNRFAIIVNGNYTGTNYPIGGTLGLSTSDNLGHNGRIKLEFNKTWNQHFVNALAGFDVREELTERNSSAFIGYDDATGSFVTPNTFISYPVSYPSGSSTLGDGNAFGLAYSSTLNRFKSYYSIVSYAYKQRYSLQGSVRFDGSNYFGVKTNHKTVPLWSTGGKWDISMERFYNLRILPELNLRATYGYNGNLSPSLVAIVTAYYFGNTNFTGLPFSTISNVPNPQLRWEKSGQLNVGVNFAFINNIVSGSFEYFKKNGSDLIGDAPIDPTTGINSLRGNFSDMRTTGFDIRLTSVNINKKFKWSTTFIFNHAKEIVTRYDNKITSSSYLDAHKFSTNIIPLVDYPLRPVFSYRWGGLNPVNGNPRIILGDTLNEAYTSTTVSNAKLSDLVYSGRFDPPYAGSILNTLSWKSVSMTIGISYKFGHYFRRNSVNIFNLVNASDGWNTANSDFSLRWQKPGDESFTNVPSFIYPDNSSGRRDHFYTNSHILIEKGDHIRLQFINLDYGFQSELIKKIGFKSLNLYLYSNNIGILWRANKLNIDPDYPFLNYPPSRTYSFGIRAGF